MKRFLLPFPAFTLLLIACAIGIPSSAQKKDKGSLQLADQYFAAGEYYTAANLYGQVLHPTHKQSIATGFPLNSRNRASGGVIAGAARLAILYKQAESYRLANYWKEAAAAYRECIEKDPAKYTDAQYWYAIAERSLGNYEAARESLTKYLNNTTADIRYKEAAEKELATLNYIQQQLARPDSVLVNSRKLISVNGSERGIFAPVHIGNNQFIVSSTEKDSVEIKGVNPNHSRLFSGSLNNGKLEMLAPITIAGINGAENQGAATLSADGQTLYFSQWKYEKGQTISSIYYSVKKPDGWGTPILLPKLNTTGYSSKQPFCSSDGKYIFFASDRPGGAGKSDIWLATLNKDGSTGEPVNAGAIINTGGDEQAPFYQSSSTTLVFSSDSRQGMGGFDLFSATGNETNWKTPENLGHPVNSSRDDIYFFAKENTALLSDAIFSSDRGTGCCLETYSIVKTPKNIRLTGKVNDCSNGNPLASAEVLLKDVTGKTWKTNTDAQGQYSFDLGTGKHEELNLSVSKTDYISINKAVSPEQVDATDMLIDKLINAVACIEKKPEPQPEPVLVIKAEDVVTVFFDFDKSVLKKEATSKLDSIYTVMLETPGATIQISGYTDGRGSEAYNKVLSDKRAKACADYIAKKGIEPSRISFVSFGACCPIEMELINGRDNAEGRSRNRRALINVKKE